MTTSLVGCLPGVEEPEGNKAQRSTRNNTQPSGTPTPTPFITSTPIPTATATPTASPTATPTIPAPTPTTPPTPTGTATPTPTPTPTSTATPTATGTPFPTPTASPTPTPIPTATPTPTPMPTPTGTPTPTPTPTPPTSFAKTIRVKYQKPSFSLASCSGGFCSTGNLNYTGSGYFNVRGATIEAKDTANGNSLGTFRLDDNGEKSFDIYSGANVEFWIYAEVDGLTGYPKVIIQDNYYSGQFVFKSPTVTFDSTSATDIYIPTGWTGSNTSGSFPASPAPRPSAPFAILDTIYASMKYYKDNGSMNIASLPDLYVNWSIENTTTSGNYNEGHIGTSHYTSVNNQLYILGKADTDTDEYDSHVIAHEWTHFMEANASRSDSLGGQHGIGDKKEPTLAFGEGFANANSALILQPDTYYKDSYGSKQQSGFGMDMETRSPTNKINPGWFSEDSVALLVFDLFDSQNTDGADTTSVPLTDLVTALTTDQKDNAAKTTIFSLVSYVKSYNSLNTSLLTYIDAVASENSIESITDPYGTGMTTNGGNPNYLPAYTNLSAGVQKDIYLYQDTIFNSLARNRFIRFTAEAGKSTAKMWIQSDDPVYFEVYGQRDLGTNSTFLGGAQYNGGNVLTYLPISVTPGQVYIVHFFSLSTITGFKVINNVEVTQE